MLDTTFFIEKGIPQEKTVNITVVKCLPGGKEETIANGTVDLRNNFGNEFNSDFIEMTATKEAKGSICKSFTYTADITYNEPKHKALYETCCKWRSKIAQTEADKKV